MDSFLVKVAAVLLYFYSSRKRKEFRRRHSRLVRQNRKLFRAGIIGEHTYVVPGSTIVDSRTRIGKFCSIAKNVSIGTTMHPVHALTTHPLSYTGEDDDLNIPPENRVEFQNKRPVHIGSDVWIGLNVAIMDGVSIGDGAVIGAGGGGDEGYSALRHRGGGPGARHQVPVRRGDRRPAAQNPLVGPFPRGDRTASAGGCRRRAGDSRTA